MLFNLILNVAAVRRIVRLVTEDVISRPLRNRLATLLFPALQSSEPELLAEASEYEGWRGSVAYGFVCRLCVGVWAAMLVIFVLPRRLRDALAIAHIAEH
jgi:hypothetical protein